MIRRPPRSTRTYTLFPYTTLFRSETTSAEGREAIRKDVSKLLENLDNIAGQTNYNGINLLDNKGKEFNFQIGEDSSFDITMETAFAANTKGLGATEIISADAESTVQYTADVNLRDEGASLTVGYAYTAGNSYDSANAGAVVVNETAVTAGGTTGDVSFTVSDAKDVQQIVISNGTTAASVNFTTDDAQLRDVLNAMVADNDALTKNADGNYTLTATANAVAAVLDFGTDKIDISSINFTGVNVGEAATNETIKFVTDEQLTITKNNGAPDIGLSSELTDTADGSEGTDSDGRLAGPGSTTAAGIAYTAGATVSIDEGSASAKVDQSAGTVTNAAIAITNEDAANDAQFSLNADGVEKLNLASGSVILTTKDSTTLAKLDAVAEVDSDLTKISEGTYTFAGTNALLDFGADKLDISDLTITGVAAAEVITVQSDNAVTVTKETDKDVGDISLEGGTANATTGAFTAGEGLVGASSDAVSISETLNALKNLGEGELTSEIANDFMEIVDTALTQLNAVRSDFGSTQNQLDSAIRNMTTTQTNIKAAESVIRDVDYAAESANFNKQNIIAQAGTYAMSQANSIQQNVMRLLQ